MTPENRSPSALTNRRGVCSIPAVGALSLGLSILALSSCSDGSREGSFVLDEDRSEGLETITIKSKRSGKCLDVFGADEADGAPLIQWGCHGGDNQRFELRPTGSGDYEIVVEQSGKCLSVGGDLMAEGSPLIQWSCHGGDEQRFEVLATDDGFVEIVSTVSGKCVDVYDAETTDGAKIIQWSCHNGDNQKWDVGDAPSVDDGPGDDEATCGDNICDAGEMCSCESDCGACSEVTYGTYQNPFSAASFWNLPIRSGAQYADARFDEHSNAFYPEQVRYHRPGPFDPPRDLISISPTSGTPFYVGDDLCKSGVNVGGSVGSWRIPDDLIITTRASNGIAVYYEDGKIQEAALFERCSYGSNPRVAWWPSEHYSITGDGLPPNGTQLGSGIGAFGGTLRAGELSSSPGVPIPHTLKVNVDHRATLGKTWPATSSDGSGGTLSSGVVKMGALLAIPPQMKQSDLNLKTEPGKKIFHAFQTYGGVIVDSSCGAGSTGQFCWMLGMEVSMSGKKIVENEIKDQGLQLNSGPFKSDMDTIFNSLHVVTNNSVHNPKGPS